MIVSTFKKNVLAKAGLSLVTGGAAVFAFGLTSVFSLGLGSLAANGLAYAGVASHATLAVVGCFVGALALVKGARFVEAFLKKAPYGKIAKCGAVATIAGVAVLASKVPNTQPFNNLKPTIAVPQMPAQPQNTRKSERFVVDGQSVLVRCPFGRDNPADEIITKRGVIGFPKPIVRGILPSNTVSVQEHVPSGFTYEQNPILAAALNQACASDEGVRERALHRLVNRLAAKLES